MKIRLFVVAILSLLTAALFADGWAGRFGGNSIDSYIFSEGLSAFQDPVSELWGYMDKSGKVVITPDFDQAYPFEGGFARVENRSMITGVTSSFVIDKKGRTVLDLQDKEYSLLSGFKEGPALGMLMDGSYAFIDIKGNIIQKLPYGEVQPLSEGLAVFLDTGNQRWGYIDAKGKEVLKPIYLYASSFHGGFACISFPEEPGKYIFIDKEGNLICLAPSYTGEFSDGLVMNGDWDEEGIYFTTYMNSKGEQVLKLSGEYQAGSFYEGRALVVKEERFAGYVDKKGNEVIKLTYDAGSRFSEGLAAVQKEGKTGFIDINGKIVIPLKYGGAGSFQDPFSYLSLANYSFHDGLCPYYNSETGLWGYIDKKGKVVLEAVNYVATGFYDGGALVFQQEVYNYGLEEDAEDGWGNYDDITEDDMIRDAWVFIDPKGEILCDLNYWEFEPLGPPSGGLLMVQPANDNVAFIDKRGVKLFKASELGSVSGFSEGLAAFESVDGMGYIDVKGKVVIPPGFEEAGMFSEGLAPVKLTEANGGGYGLIDKTGKIVLRRDTSLSRVSGGLVQTEIPDPKNPDLLVVTFLDTKGKVVLRLPQYTSAGYFNQNRAFVSGKHDRYGFIDQSGKEIVAPLYKDVMPYSEGLAAVLVGNKVGFIDLNGKMVIEPQFDAPFHEVGMGGDWYSF